ncbi:MAG: hypothetical protein KC486_09385 [Myxococcales bacterium]|nr:hypothetical protein [Myxococcales bacterium]
MKGWQRALLCALFCALFCALACADDPRSPVGPAASAPLCGEEGPLRLLALADDERFRGARDLSRIAGRYYITVELEGEAQTFDYPTRTYSVGLCGEDPQVVGENLHGAPFTLRPWPEVPVACRTPENRLGYSCELVALDPTGGAPPTVVLPLPEYSDPWAIIVDDGVMLRESYADAIDQGLTFHAYADGPTPTFAAGLDLGLPEPTIRDFALRGDELFAITTDALELYHLTLPELSATLVAEDAAQVAANATHVLYVSGSAAVLRERATGIETVISDCSSGYPEVDARFAHVDCANDGGGAIVDLASSANLTYAPGRRAVRSLADGRWLLETDETGALVDVSSGAENPLELTLKYQRYWIEPDALLALDDYGSLLREPFDGGPLEALAARASGDFLRLSDGRVVTDVPLVDGTTALVVVDRGSLDERLIDTEVVLYTDGVTDNPAVPSVETTPSSARALDPDVLAYQVIDGERSGLYLIDLSAGSR